MERALKFCMVSTFYPPYNFGGDGMHIYRLSNELAQRGHRVDVFHCEDSYLLLNRKPPVHEFPNHPNVRVHGLRSRRGVLSPLLTQQTGIPFFKGKIKSALESNNYDVIHYNNMSLIGIQALSYGSAIKLYTAHEHWLVCPMHVLWKFNREVCSKRSCFSCQLRGGRPPQLWRYTGMLKKHLKNVDCFLSPSKFTLRKHIEMGLEIPIRHMPYFLPTPVAEDKTNSKSYKLLNRRPFFLFVGRIEYIKGLHTIVPAFLEQDKYDLLVAGDGEYLAQMKAQLDDDPRVRFLGRLDQSRLNELYEAAVAVVVPSICYETFGIVVIEAFSRKTPVIVNDLGALPEVVDESGGGMVYRNREELMQAMTTLAEDAEHRKELGMRGYFAFMQKWNERAHLDRYLGLIDELMLKKGSVRMAQRGKGPAAAAAASALLHSDQLTD
jgi:glycosyltransferase involved in cell wall biosynthesis